LFQMFLMCLPGVVHGHGFMSIPMPRTGYDESTSLNSPKLGPWSGYREEIDNSVRACYGPGGPGPSNAEQFPRTQFATAQKVTAGQPFTVMWDIRLGHQAPLNHIRIAYRTFTAQDVTTSEFKDGILFEKEDTAEDRAAGLSPTFSQYLTTQVHNMQVTIPAETPAGPAEIQWVWASERDGPGGYYITCAVVEIVDNGGGLLQPTPPPTPMMTPDPNSGTTLQCYDGIGTSATEITCPSLLNPRCMASWVNSEYYYRCANADFCVQAKAGAANEGKSGGQTFQRALTSLECCDFDLCNVANIVKLPAGINSSWKSIPTLGMILGLLQLLL